MPYLWIPDKSRIQLHLGTNSTILIATTEVNPQDYLESLAIQWENYTVRYLTGWLNAGWDIHENSTPSETLIDIASEMTAAMIGNDKLTTEFGRSGTATWTTITLVRVHQRIGSLFLSHDVNDLDATTPKKRMTFEQRLLAAQSRSTQFLVTQLGR